MNIPADFQASWTSLDACAVGYKDLLPDTCKCFPFIWKCTPEVRWHDYAVCLPGSRFLKWNRRLLRVGFCPCYRCFPPHQLVRGKYMRLWGNFSHTVMNWWCGPNARMYNGGGLFDNPEQQGCTWPYNPWARLWGREHLWRPILAALLPLHLSTA